MVLTLRNLRWWCFSFHQLAKILHFQSWPSSPAATCAGGIYIYICIPPAQVAQCQRHLGQKYRSGMQQTNAGSTRARSALRWCPCASCIWLLHLASILVPKMVLTLCNLRWWCFSFHPLAKILHLQSWSSSAAATCTGGVFPWRTSTFTNVCTNE